MEGLFRISSSKERREGIKDMIDAGRMEPLSELCHDVHSAASLLAQYLRELPQPLFNAEAQKRLSAINCMTPVH